MDSVIDLGRRQRKRQAVHQQILEAGLQLFREHGVARTTVDDIAEAADVARQTFFNHFPYKEALAVELAAEGIQEVAQHAQAILEAGTPALDVLQRTAESVLETAIEDGELSVVAARELLHADPERALRAAQQVPLAAIFEAILEQAREEGSLRATLCPHSVAAHISAALRYIIGQILARDVELSRRELCVWFDMVLNGIVDRRQ